MDVLMALVTVIEPVIVIVIVIEMLLIIVTHALCRFAGRVTVDRVHLITNVTSRVVLTLIIVAVRLTVAHKKKAVK